MRPARTTVTHFTPPVAVFILVFVLITPSGSARAQTADADPWWGRDKALHLSASASLAIVGYAGTSMGTESRSARAAGGAALAVGAGVAKELWDLEGHGDASWKDLTWDLIGATTGVLFSLAVDWSIHRFFRPAAERSR
jgi:putative lipoprotein